MFHPYVTISAGQVCESDDLRNANLAIFFLSFFFCGRARNPGIWEAAKDSSGASSTKREKEGRICGLHMEEPSN